MTISTPAPTTAGSTIGESGSAARPVRLGLVRGLGLWSAVAVVMGTMIGTGIFLKPAEVARDAGSLSGAMLAWFLGALVSLTGALSYIELGAAMPEAGADYVYLSRGFSPAVGFLYGWKHAVVSSPASMAALASGTVVFAGYFLPGVNHTIAQLGPIPITSGKLLAISIILAVAAVNLLPVRTVGRAQVALTALKVVSVVLVIAAGFLASGAGAPGAPSISPPEGGALRGVIAGATASLWAYSGWHTLLRMGSEVVDPDRNLPRAILGGFAGTAVMFLLLNFACFRVLGFAGVAGSSHVVADMLERAIGPGVAGWLTVAMIVAAIGTLNGTLLAGARVTYALGRDGFLSPRLGHVTPVTRVPAGSVGFTVLFGAVLVLTGTFEDLTSLFVFTQWTFFALGAIALFRLRRREPNLRRPARAWGYPVLPGVFVVVSVLMALTLFLDRPLRSAIGLLLILSGLVFYRFRVSSKHPDTEQPT